MLDEVDKELERRGHCFARYADDANVYVRSVRAGQRVMALLRHRYAKLHLVVNESKSAVVSVFGRKFLGYSLWMARGGEVKRKVAAKPLDTFKQRIRELTRRSGGRGMSEVMVHPLVWTHRSGRKSLVIGSHADSISGMPIPHGRSLLVRLQEWAAQPAFSYRHEWQEGDFVIWDNCGCMHRVVSYDESSGRRMHRTTIMGEERVA